MRAEKECGAAPARVEVAEANATTQHSAKRAAWCEADMLGEALESLCGLIAKWELTETQTQELETIGSTIRNAQKLDAGARLLDELATVKQERDVLKERAIKLEAVAGAARLNCSRRATATASGAKVRVKTR